MSYQALYRVWRPRTFEDVVGQTHITRTLQNAIEQDKFSHAYLFSGPRGTGKTSAAKIFAQTINCEHAPVKEPCNECAACRGIQDGSVSDVIEIDAASNTSVDDIRDIRDKVKYAPSTVPYKVYIIDEVHMISVNAFNALLKTLEEPPKHVVFILATTEPHKIPLTIISRCQRFDFKPISNQSIVGRMQTIMQAENIQVTDEALESVALAAEGGMRDALSILDQAISYSKEQVTLEDVLAVTGGVSQIVLHKVVSAMEENNVQDVLVALDEMIRTGKDPGKFVQDLIYFMRDLLLYRSSASLADMLERAVADDSFKQLSERVTNQWIQRSIIELNQCQQEMKWSNSPKVFIEIALLTITNYGQEHAVEVGNHATSASESEVVLQLQSKMQQMEKDIMTLKENPPASNKPIKQTPTERRRPNTRSSKNSYKIPYDRIRDTLGRAEKSELKNVHAHWANFLSKLKTTNAPAHATIQDSKPAAASNDTLIVAFKYEIHCSLFLDHREMAESLLGGMDKQRTIIPIPEEAWNEVRNDYIQNQDKPKEESEDQQSNPVVDEARKLFGDDLLEIHD
ncbi:DNA polymerase III subunit gamma/tau [Oceanobacillus kimchii]|uniref:DNA polymerase III subunit gamma/tau n=1 Tax=Oceanobacillus kimchii TaxID=746691 RepID=UPI0021A6F9EC|nr:DNA polymerase III subunit gamma/tau [Oceanobacillus kimchii]MCT1577223.1 DNA polymerase III subunit gamma/tau [Oceanobacillus kimchii]MCT2135293.1 DNA polymerase III subunit gamma/tau [Oceanobacillus kimchii]